MSATPSVTTTLVYPGTANDPNLYDVYFKGNNVFNPGNLTAGTPYDEFCLVENIQIPVNATFTSYVYSSYELTTLKSIPGLAKNLNLDKLDSINWLLNNWVKLGVTYSDAQGAIWKMMGSKYLVDYFGPQDPAKIDALVAGALLHDGYVPGVGELIGVVLDPMSGSTHRQPLIVAMQSASLGDRVWHDANANGIQDTGETGIAGATVELIRDQNQDGDFKDAGEVLASATTDARGNYAFTGLTPGLIYQVRFTLPTGYDYTSPRQSDGSAGSGANSDAMISNTVVLGIGENNTGIDAGFFKAAKLGDRVWNDTNGNGQQDAGETGVAGVKVTLIGGGLDGKLETTADNTSVSTTTDANGNYKFENLAPGKEYQVQFDQPAGSAFTRADVGNDSSDSDAGSDGKSQVIVLESGENNTTVDAGIVKPASLGDRVWMDANANGRQDAGEAGVAGVNVTLIGGGADGKLSTTGDNTSVATTTDANGKYLFDGLAAGVEYRVQFGAQQGTVFTRGDIGDDAGDSDANANGLTPIVKLTSGENNTTIDAGLYVPASLGDRVWLDANGNGQQDAGEQGVAGARVTLIGGGLDGKLSTLDDNTEVSTTTDADGNYKFTNLVPGAEYQVKFAAPSGTVLTAANKGDDASDSDAGAGGLSQVVTLAMGEDNTSIDAGVYKPASLGDYVWHDANANGRQDAGEAGIAGVKVTLVGGGLDGKIATADDNVTISTTTGANGAYRFDGLTPGMEYQLSFGGKDGYVASGADLGDDDESDSDAGEAGKSQIVTLVSGEHNGSIDAGVYRTASLGDRVWVDANGNGQQDGGETGVAGVKVTLLGGGADGKLSTLGDNTEVSVTTDANGNYKFDGLTPGVEYQLAFDKPAGSVFTHADSGSDGSDSDAGEDGKSQVIVLDSGENDTTIDAGIYMPASLGDRVWLDANGNGQQDAGELGVAGATVTLIGGGIDGKLSTTGDNTEVSVTTDADGKYHFDGLTPGAEYQVRFTAPDGQVFTRANSGNDASDSDAGNGGLSQVVKLVSGENNSTIDAGVYAPAALGDRVWLDANANGQQDDGEEGVAGVKVTLVGGGLDGLIATTGDNTRTETTTDADGKYRFDGLAAGVQYQVEFSKPVGAVFTGQDKGSDSSDSDAGVNGKSQVVTLASGETNTTIDAGIYVPASLGDRVWHDANANGKQDANEAGIAGVKVTLVSGGADGSIATTGDNVEVSTLTDASGNYKFNNLLPGQEYQVRFDTPSGYVASGANVGADDSDSDAAAGGLSQIVKLGSGENDTTIDAGFYKPASLGDRVWVDANGNGQQDSGETGVSGATVTLIGGGEDGLIATEDDNTCVQTTTDANGNYKFDGLTPGMEYQVQFSAPAGSVLTSANRGNDASDSDAGVDGLSQVVKLASGENNTTIDAGVYTPAALGDRVWLDANANGQQDDGEQGVAGVTVTLLGGGADGLLSTTADNTSVETTTDADGKYRFDGLAPGVEYQVQFAKPADTLFTAANKGIDASDSDAGNNGLSQVVKLASGEINTSIDAGLYRTASLGDRVWFDANTNGLQDAGETGIAGVKVTLLGGGADGLLSTTGDNTKVETTTDANGNYRFDGLTPGAEYQVRFDTPDGFVATTRDAGDDVLDSDAGTNGLSQVVNLGSGEHNATIDAGFYKTASLGDRVWLDANGNGRQDAGEQGVAGAKVVLTSGGADGLISTTADNTKVETTTDANGNYLFDGLAPGVEYQVQFGLPSGAAFTRPDAADDALDSDAGVNGLSQIVKLGSGEHNASIDAGIYQTASLGDRVWVDANANGQQDAGEQGAAGVKVTLLGGGADGLLSTVEDNTSTESTTDADGKYRFDGLAPGVEYQVRFDAPAGSSFTRADVGNDASDSDAGAGGLSQVVKLASGENNTTIDAGIFQSASLGDRVWFDANGNGQQDAGEQGVAGAKVTLIGGGADGLVSTAADNTSVDTTTDANGNYLFEGLAPGMEYQVKFEAPAGSVFTRADAGDDLSDSDAKANGLSQIVKLASGEKNTSIDAGVYMPASLGDRVWVDANGNGQQDAGEQGAAGVKVTLISGGADGLVSTTGDNTTVDTTTDANGNYKFEGLTAGQQYQVQFGKPSGTVFTGQDKGNDSSDSDANVNGLSQVVTLAAGENNTTIDAGVYTAASLGNRVWLDANANGQQDANEAGVAGVTVTLAGGGADGLMSTTGDNVAFSTTTDANGNYLFKDLVPGMQYQLTFGKPANLQFTKKDVGNDASDSDADLATGKAQVLVLKSGEYNDTVDAGLYASASLGDRLWIDTNANGIQDDGATGLAGRTVTLIGGGADGLISTTGDNTRVSTVTGADGVYNFSNLTPGVQYQVEFSKPTGTIYTGAGIGGDALDSDANASTGLTRIVTLASGENNKNLDAGLVNVTGDLAITKTDGLTFVTAGQTITYKIVVTNTGTAIAADALVKDAIPSTLTNVTWTSSATNGASGNQLSGSGSINDTVTMAGGSSITYTVTAKVAALVETVSDFSTLATNANVGASRTVNGITAEAGTFFGTSVSAASLWARNQGEDKGIGVLSKNENSGSGESVTGLSNQANNEVIRLTKEAGEQWSSLWVSNLDADGSGGAEIGTLYWSDEAMPDLSKLTTKFTFKYGDFGVGAESGDVLSVRPSNFNADAKYVFFVAGANSAGTNNDYLVWKAGTVPSEVVNTATVTAPSTFIDTNPNNNSATDIDDIKLPAPTPVKRGSIGDTVWEDLNYNGVRETGENGVKGVTVKLLDANGKVLETTVTDANGKYLFDNLNAGNYRVEVVEPEGYFATKANVGNNDTIDSDIDQSNGRTGLITLAQGENDLTWDAGLYRKASLGDKVWEDKDHDGIQDSGEGGIGGVTVQLYSASGALLATTKTNSAGNYKFSNLDPGTYWLKFDKGDVMYNGVNMDNWKWGKKNIGSNDAIDSDVNGDGVSKVNVTRTDNITLSSGENDMSWDATITPIAIDLNGDGVHTVARANAGGTFDLLGNGSAIASGWLSSSDGFLAVDRNGNGKIDDISELFGGAHQGAGFSQLASYDSNGDGVVNAQDAAFGELRIWQDANGNHQTDDGELLSLAQAGVVSLNVGYTVLPFVDAEGNLHLERSSALLSNGQVADMTDVYFSIDARDAAAAGAPTLADLLAAVDPDAAVPVAIVGHAEMVM